MPPEAECHRGSLSIGLRGARCRGEIARTTQGFLTTVLCFALGLLSTGCSGNLRSAAKSGSISVATSNGQSGAITELAILDTLQLSMTPSSDGLSAGVDWTVSCGGNPRTGSTTGGACGTLLPAHTADGAATVYTAPSVVPINQAVTITAAVTSNPSQMSRITFTIVSSSIAVSVGVGELAIANTLPVNQSVNISATVANDPLNAGVTLTASCGSAACGVFGPINAFNAPLYTASYTAPSVVPTDSTVTIKATSVTDTTKWAIVTLKIASPTPAGVAVSVVPGSLYVDTGNDATNRFQLTAFVANDPDNAGVTWSTSCSSLIGSACGSISNTTTSHATYTAPSYIPSGGTVTITATSITNPAISKTARANIIHGAPITVSGLSPKPPATLAAESSLSFSATTTDPNHQGADWTVTCASAGACGTFTSSHTAEGAQTTYIAPPSIPAGGNVVIAVSPTSTPSYPTVAPITIFLGPSVSLTQPPPCGQTLLCTMTATTQATVSATVANDATDSGVNWSVCQAPLDGNSSPSNCGNPSYGYVYPPQTASGAIATYTAPPASPGTSLVIQATSVAASSPSIQSGTAAISKSIDIAANTPSVNFIPSLPAKIQPNGTVNLLAAVANDSAEGGIDWQVCGNGCGYFTISPAVPADPGTGIAGYPAKVTTSVRGWPSGTPLPYTAPSEIPDSGIVTITAKARADNSKSVSGTIAIDNDPAGPSLNGKVLTGSDTTGTTQPVAGSLVSLYVAGTNGIVNRVTNGVVEIEYSVQATELASTTSGKDGSFIIPAGYDCPSSSSQLYLVASGGSVGINSSNANLALMTALGSCSNLSSTPMIVNEVTTIASAFATGPFAANDTLYGTSSDLYLGTSSTNISGLVNAFAAVNNLVDITTGHTRFVTPAGNGIVPYALINSLADILNACAVTSGGVEGDGSACGTLLYGTDILNARQGGNSYLGSNSAPGDTLQAAFNLAQIARYNAGQIYQINNSNTMWNLATSASPFQPIETPTGHYGSAISIHYTGGGGISSKSTVGSLAVDAGGNIWITDTHFGTVAEWNATGAPVVGAQIPTAQDDSFQASPFAAVPKAGPMAIDASGNIWVSGDGVLAQIVPNGTQAPGSPFRGVAEGGSDMAIDQGGHIWLANYSGVNEFDSTGAPVPLVDGGVNPEINTILSIGVDGSSGHNIWVGNSSGVAELTNPGGELIANSSGGGGGSLPQMAADSKGDMSLRSTTRFCPRIAPDSGQGIDVSTSCLEVNQAINSSGFTPPVSQGRGLAFDGRGTIWVGDSGGNASSPGLDALYPNYSVNSWSAPNSTQNGASSSAAPSLGAGTLRMAIDGSGNIWVLLSDNSVTEFVGEAVPVVAPVALGLKNNKLATMP